jgi:hypothetical protein
MYVAARLAGVEVPSASSHKKLYCPFGEFSHADGGDEPAFRVYSDHAFCFACWQWWTPVSLCASVWEVAEELVAERLLREAGVTPLTYQEQWDQAVAAPMIDHAALTQALKTRCLREHVDWNQRQYDPDVAEYLAKCLGLLIQVTSEDEARQWLETCAVVMRAVLRKAAQ